MKSRILCFHVSEKKFYSFLCCVKIQIDSSANVLCHATFYYGKELKGEGTSLFISDVYDAWQIFLLFYSIYLRHGTFLTGTQAKHKIMNAASIKGNKLLQKENKNSLLWRVRLTPSPLLIHFSFYVCL